MEDLEQLVPFPADNTHQYLLKLAHINTRLGHMQPHEHIYAELVIGLEGRAVNIIDGRESLVLPGDVYMLLPGMTHEQREMENYRFCILKFDYDALMAEAGEMKNLPGFQLVFVLEPKIRQTGGIDLEGNPSLDSEALSCVEGLTVLLERELREQGPEYEELSRQMFLSLVAVVSRRCIRRTDRTMNRTTGQLAESMSYMERHYREEITLDDLASRAHYSRRHYTRLFRDCFCTSPLAYLNRIRLRQACSLLTGTQLTAAEISRQCGFSDPSTFCRRFKQQYGITPQQYRNWGGGRSRSGGSGKKGGAG